MEKSDTTVGCWVEVSHSVSLVCGCGEMWCLVCGLHMFASPILALVAWIRMYRGDDLCVVLNSSGQGVL